MNNPPRATIDFETRSACDIKRVGSWKYSLDPSTQVLCLAYKLPGDFDVTLWHPEFPEFGVPAQPAPERLFEWIAEGGLVEAHNAFFEQGIWVNQCQPKYGWPEVPLEQWRCSAAKAAALALPRKLEDVANALRLKERKDSEGHKLMLKLSKPRKPRKAERAEMERRGIDPASVTLWPGTWADFERLFEYCVQDVRTEEEVSNAIPDLRPLEQHIWMLDQRINRRGFYLDVPRIQAALSLVDSVTGGMTDELPELTGGAVERASQRSRLLAWLQGRGVAVWDTQGTTFDTLLDDNGLDRTTRRVIEIARDVNRTSTAKLVAMLERVCPDCRARGSLLYHGASTGRWAGAGVQPHNFPRGDIKDMELAWDVIAQRDPELVELLYGSVMEFLSHALRGAITATPGKRLFVADYSAIEARVVFWLANDEHALDIFRRGECIYCDMATAIYNRVINKKDHPDERQMGKQAVLGLGYQMGWSKFKDTCAKYGIIITEEFAKFVVDTYRERYWRVKQMWYAQEDAAIEAVRNPRKTIPCGRVQWRFQGRFLYCRLPSGRKLGYCEPKLVKGKTPWGAEKDMLTFMGVDPYTKKWQRQKTYGGTLVENITQAVARDLMAEAIVRVEETRVYEVLLSVHDELIAEADVNAGDVREFEGLLSELPEWAAGCPVAAEGWTGFRYRK